MTYLDIVSFACWNLSPTWQIVRPVTQAYRNIASCSSSDTNFESPYPIKHNSEIRARNTCTCTPSSVRIHSGWPWSSSWTHASPDRMDVWYGRLVLPGVKRVWGIFWMVGITRTRTRVSRLAICSWISSLVSDMGVVQTDQTFSCTLMYNVLLLSYHLIRAYII